MFLLLLNYILLSFLYNILSFLASHCAHFMHMSLLLLRMQTKSHNNWNHKSMENLLINDFQTNYTQLDRQKLIHTFTLTPNQYIKLCVRYICVTHLFNYLEIQWTGCKEISLFEKVCANQRNRKQQIVMKTAGFQV